jgi:pimeloyl-ACP methyl ester carboxylesterase
MERANEDIFDRLYVEVSGPEDGPPVLMLHGWASSAELMRPAGTALTEGFRVYNIDLPGHGRTPPPPRAWGVPEFADLVARFIKDRGLEPVTVVGHSNGGRIALFMASDERLAALIGRLVLISPSGVTPARPLSYYVRSTCAKALKAPFAVLPERFRGRGLDWLRSTVYWRLLSSSDYENAQGVMRETFVRTVTHHLDERLARIRVPTLLFWGDQDTAVSRRQMDILEREIPDAGLVVLEGAGHYGYLDAPDIYNAALAHFMQEPAQGAMA